MCFPRFKGATEAKDVVEALGELFWRIVKDCVPAMAADCLQQALNGKAHFSYIGSNPPPAPEARPDPHEKPPQVKGSSLQTPVAINESADSTAKICIQNWYGHRLIAKIRPICECCSACLLYIRTFMADILPEALACGGDDSFTSMIVVALYVTA